MDCRRARFAPEPVFARAATRRRKSAAHRSLRRQPPAKKGAIAVIDFNRNYFELFGLPARFDVDAAALDRAYRALQTEVHPDRFAAGTDAERRVAMQSAARVNEAYRALKDPVARASPLLALHGVAAADETDTALDIGFLERQL